MNELVKVIKKARFVFVCGNGGSASTAEHFTNDLFSKGIKAICLNSNTAIMTMIANDFGYEYVFSRQLEVYATNEDMVITISCSGTSPNIVKVHEGFRNWASFETFDDVGFVDYGELEDRHLAFAHEVAMKL